MAANNSTKIEKVRAEVEQGMEAQYEQLAIFTDGQPWNKRRYIQGAKDALEQHVLSGIDAGKRLIVLRGMLDHGEWLKALDDINIPAASARRLMTIAANLSHFPPELVDALGTTKLALLAPLPKSELSAFAESGKLRDMSQDDVIEMTTRELAAKLKEAVEKSKLALDAEKIQKDLLHTEKKQLESENLRLQKEIEVIKTGEPPKDPLPAWWHELNDTTASIKMLAVKLTVEPPDLSQELVKARCDFCMQLLDSELAHVRRWLVNCVVDPVKRDHAAREKLAVLSTDPRFDFSLIDDNNNA